MKTKNKIAIATLLLCGGLVTGVGFGAMGNQTAYAEEQSTSIFEVQSAALRIPDATYGEGIRFTIVMDKDTYVNENVANLTTGVLLMPAYAMDAEGLVVESENTAMMNITEGVYWSEEDGVMKIFVHLYNIPETEYATDVSIRAYVDDNDTSTTPMYTDVATSSVAKAASWLYENDATLSDEEKATLKATYLTYDVFFHDGEEVEKTTGVYGEKISAPVVDEKAGYTFGGWWNEAGTAQWHFDETTISGTTTNLYAKWDMNTYTAKVVRADGSEETVEFTIENRAEKLSAIALTANDAQYTYSWVSALPTELALNNDQVFTETKTMNKYTITFNTNGGEAMEPISVDYGTPVSALASITATKVGFTFVGWTLEDGSEIPADAMVTADVTVKAVWKDLPFSIGFEGDNDTPNVAVEGSGSYEIVSAETEAVKSFYDASYVFYNHPSNGAWALRYYNTNNGGNGLKVWLSNEQRLALANGGALSFNMKAAPVFDNKNTFALTLNGNEVAEVSVNLWPAYSAYEVTDTAVLKQIAEDGYIYFQFLKGSAASGTNNYYMWLDDITVAEPDYTTGVYFVERYVAGAEGYELYDFVMAYGDLNTMSDYNVDDITNFKFDHAENTTIEAGKICIVKAYYESAEQLIIDFEDGVSHAEIIHGSSANASKGDGYNSTMGLWCVTTDYVEVKVTLTADQIAAIKTGGTLSFVAAGRAAAWVGGANISIAINGMTTLHPTSDWSQYTQMNNRAQTYTITDGATLSQIVKDGYISFKVTASGTSVTRFVVDDIQVTKSVWKNLTIDFEDGESHATVIHGSSAKASAGDGYDKTMGLWCVTTDYMEVQIALTEDQIALLNNGGTLSFVAAGRAAAWVGGANISIAINGMTTLHPTSDWSSATQMNNRAQTYTITDASVLADIVSKGYISFKVTTSGTNVTRFVVDNIIVSR